MAQALNAASFPIGNDTTLDPALTHYCAPKHWDATRIYRHVVPQGTSVPLPTDPRPYSKICYQYRTSGAFESAPNVPSNMVFPMGGEFYPPNRYAAAIDDESKLRRLDRPLNQDILPGDPCVPNQYVLPPTSDSLQQYSLLPPQIPPKSKMVQELQDPKVTHNLRQYQCSQEAMICELKGADRFWNNHTKLTKYKQKGTECGDKLWGYVKGNEPSSLNLPVVTEEPTQSANAPRYS